MKYYKPGKWSCSFIYTFDGSVIPKALVWGIPSATCAAILSFLYYDVFDPPEWHNASSITAVWSGATFVLGFLVVFRSQQAYSRFWEGASLLRQIRGEWLNATSSIIAFCTPEKELRSEVEAYQHLLVRLVSMLHSCALQTVADMEDVHLARFSSDGIDAESMRFLANLEDKRHRCEVITQWIQRHICAGMRGGIVTMAPPIVSRVFQEISRGVVNLSNARKLTEIPFPFPIAQMLQCMLVIYVCVTPVIAGMVIDSKIWASVFTFAAVFSFTGVNYIAIEIESPFGNDRNDLPLDEMQHDMNQSLWILLDRRAQEPPKFTFDRKTHREYKPVRESLTKVADATSSSGTCRGNKSIFDSDWKILGSRTSQQSAQRSSWGTALSSTRGSLQSEEPGPPIQLKAIGTTSTIETASTIGSQLTPRGSGEKTPRGSQANPIKDTEDFNDLPQEQPRPSSMKEEVIRVTSQLRSHSVQCQDGLQIDNGFSFDERLDQIFTALQTSLNLHISNVVALSRQQIGAPLGRRSTGSLTLVTTPTGSPRFLE